MKCSTLPLNELVQDISSLVSEWENIAALWQSSRISASEVEDLSEKTEVLLSTCKEKISSIANMRTLWNALKQKITIFGSNLLLNSSANKPSLLNTFKVTVSCTSQHIRLFHLFVLKK